MRSLVHRCRLLHPLCINFSTVYSRGTISPLIKNVHPDLFFSEAEEVRKQNLRCIQNLNEFWDTFIKFENFIRNSNAAPTVLKNSYDFSCYLREENKSNEFGSVTNCNLQRLDFILNVPLRLTRPVQDVSGIERSLQELLSHFGMFFSCLNEKNPWPRARSRKLEGENQQPGYEIADIDRMAFERIIIKSRSASQNSVFESSSKKPSYKVIESQVNFFIERGNIFVKGLSHLEEFESIRRLKEFLIAYGLICNFSPESWRTIYFVIYGNSAKGDSHTKNSGTAIGRYRSRVVMNRQLLHIPKNFRNSELLEFIRCNVACASLLSASPIF